MMGGRIVYASGHYCGPRPTAVCAGAIWRCDECGRRWIYRVADPRRGLSWRWERWYWPWNRNSEQWAQR